MSFFHQVGEISFTRDRMMMTVDGESYSCALKDVSERLAKASDLERQRYDISPSGYGVHWPLLDEDVSVGGLLRAARKEADSPANRPMAVAEGRVAYGSKGRKT